MSPGTLRSSELNVHPGPISPDQLQKYNKIESPVMLPFTITPAFPIISEKITYDYWGENCHGPY